MAVDLSRRLAQTVERELPNIRALSDEQASIARAPGNGVQRKNWATS
jgi:hypothetical protein